MRQDVGGVLAGERAEVLLTPEVAHAPASHEAEGVEVDRDAGGDGVGVEEREHERAVAHRLRPDFRAGPLRHARGLRAQFVLAGLDHLVVREQRTGEVVQLREVAADQERRAEDRPHGHVGVLFVGREARGTQLPPSEAADDEHVGVVPGARTRVRPRVDLLVHD